MDSYLSGFSRGYTGNIGTGHAGSMSGAGSVSAAGGQNVDVTQLKTGDTFQGEITSVNGEDVQIQLANGQYLAAKLARDVQVALGQVMNLQVQSNKDNRVVLKPVYDGNSQMLRVGEAALRAANMAVNEKNLQLVAKLIENGMSIDKNTLMTYNRLALQNSNIDLSNIIKLNKLQLPVTQENARQLENYQNLEHKILDGVKSAADELVKTFESLLGEGTPLSNVPAGALQNGAKFMEQALTLLGGENDPESAAVKTQPGEAGTTAGAVNGEASEQAGTASAEKTADMGNVAMQQEGVKIIRGDLPKDAQGIPSDKIQEQLQQEGQTQTTSADSAQKNAEGESFKELLNLIKGEKSENVPDKIIQYMSSGKAQFKDIRQFLLDTEFGKSLTPEQKAKIFHSDPFKSLLKDGLQKQ